MKSQFLALGITASLLGGSAAMAIEMFNDTSALSQQQFAAASEDVMHQPSVTGQTATGESQVTIVDDNGRLRIQDEKTQPAPNSGNANHPGPFVAPQDSLNVAPPVNAQDSVNGMPPENSRGSVNGMPPEAFQGSNGTPQQNPQGSMNSMPPANSPGSMNETPATNPQGSTNMQVR